MSRKHQQANLAGFPMLLNTDISELLFHIGVPIHVEDLSKPTGATAQAIWSGLLGALMACPVEDLEGPKQAVLGMLPYRVSWARGRGAGQRGRLGRRAGEGEEGRSG